MKNNFFYMGLGGGGANLSLHPPFRKKGGAPVPMHSPGYRPDANILKSEINVTLGRLVENGKFRP